jgi:outer membrane protein assembly factor BamB
LTPEVRQLPPGFKISLWAEGLPNARSLAVGSKGTVFVGSRLDGNVYAVVDKGGTREVKIITKTSPATSRTCRSLPKR